MVISSSMAFPYKEICADTAVKKIARESPEQLGN
jgi:hypothetical protein